MVHPGRTMAASLKLFYALFLLCISSQGMSQPCGLSSIQVTQSCTGVRSGFDYEFVVEIKNVCHCAQRNVRVHAPGFASHKAVSPTVLRQDGGAGTYLINGGNTIPAGAAIKFSYWWSHYTKFSPADSQPICT